MLPAGTHSSFAGMIVSCLLLGIGIYWREAAVAAVGIFAMICLLAGTLYFIGEVNVALSSVRHETRRIQPEIRSNDLF